MIKVKMMAISDVLLNTVHPISPGFISTDSTISGVNFPVGWICGQTPCRCGVSVTVFTIQGHIRALSVSGGVHEEGWNQSAMDTERELCIYENT